MISQLKIEPIILKTNSILNVPSSKSLSIRALILASISKGKTTIRNILCSKDTDDCLNALQDLGTTINNKNNKITINGCGGIYDIKSNNINVGSSGITCRFLLSIICASLAKQNNNKEIIFDGSEQLRKRTIKPLVDSLLKLGANITYLDKDGFLPLKIKSSKFKNLSKLEVSGLLSSQYVSAILMMAPLLENPIDIYIKDIDSENHPYIKMAIKTMQDFGINNIICDTENDIYSILPQLYSPVDFTVETDFNTANYFFAIGAITGGSIEIKNLNKNTLQPGLLFLDVLEKMGCIVENKQNSIKLTGPKKLKGGFEINMFQMAEMAILLAVIATFADDKIKIYGIKHIRNHECDRITAICNELTKAGITIYEFDDGLIIEPGKAKFFNAETYNDHRIAMSLSIFGICGNGANIINPSCVSKTCPEFYDLLKKLGAKIKYEYSI